MKIDGSFFRHLEAIGAAGVQNAPKQNERSDRPAVRFEDVLKEAESKVSFTKHAMRRLDERGIEISEKELDKLGSAIQIAQAKGIKETLVLIGGKAFIVNAPTNTVITVIDGSSEDEPKVFSNLSGAVVL